MAETTPPINETTTSEKLISCLIKLLYSLPFLGVMYYMSTENKENLIDSPLKLFFSLFWIIIWFISFLFSVVLMCGLLPLNFESAKNKDDTKSPMTRLSYEFWIPFIYMMYNFFFPLIISIAGSDYFQFEFVNKYFNSSISLRQISNAPSWKNFWWWVGSRIL